MDLELTGVAIYVYMIHKHFLENLDTLVVPVESHVRRELLLKDGTEKKI